MAVGEDLADVDLTMITVVELARMLKLSPRAVWRLRSAGRMPAPIRLGGAVRWRLVEIQNWITAGCPPTQARENEGRRN